jgi:hypothetical protein
LSSRTQRTASVAVTNPSIGTARAATTAASASPDGTPAARAISLTLNSSAAAEGGMDMERVTEVGAKALPRESAARDDVLSVFRPIFSVSVYGPFGWLYSL